MLFCLCTTAVFCELSLKIIFPQRTVGICHLPSSQRGQSKSKLQSENHRGNSVILLTRITLNLIRQVRWPDVDRDVSAGGARSCRTEAVPGEGGVDHCRGHRRTLRSLLMPSKIRSWGQSGQTPSQASCSYSEPVFPLVFAVILITSLKCNLAPSSPSKSARG